MDLAHVVHFTSFTTNDPTEEYLKATASLPSQIGPPTAKAANWELKAPSSVFDEYTGMYGPLPNFQAVGKLRVGETVEEILKADLAVEQEAVPMLKDAIAHCETVRDYNSRELFESILDSEEDHIDFLETQLQLIDRVGLPNLLEQHSVSLSSRAGRPFQPVVVAAV